MGGPRIVPVLALLALPAPARAADAEACPCEETWSDVLEGGDARIIAGSVLMASGATGAGVGLGYLVSTARREHGSPGGWSALEQEYHMMLMIPVLAGAAMAVSGFIVTSVGAGMRLDAIGLSGAGVPIERLCYPGWKALHELGRRYVLIGWTILVAGLEIAAIGLGTNVNARLHPDPEFSSWSVGIIGGLMGAIMVTAGIVSVINGHRIMKGALDLREPSLSLALAAGGAALVW